jgi:hypothetical protein
MRSALLTATLWASVAALLACGPTDPPAAACEKYVVSTTTDLTTPSVSFANDVVPIFRQSCAIAGSTCHGSTTPGRIFLGSTMAPVDPSTIRAQIVDVTSTDLPSMALVKAGEPENSFLMRKMDGDQCILDAQCVDGDCLTSMPQASPLLDVPARDVVRRWIAQGALDD